MKKSRKKNILIFIAFLLLALMICVTTIYIRYNNDKEITPLVIAENVVTKSEIKLYSL